ncbi:hypothetical protein EDD21DRAFT_189556 [Dissophora ornata]|nr:hypothetical protein BGZ58_001588 [Dissophora ornata]KAI8598372.1 hypothetical protein EDD21DRAFT_189556 [Dissophora ornata]
MVLITIPTTISKEVSTTTFARLDTDSTVMLEFQGVIEMDGTTWAANPLGQLSVLDGGRKAQLVIGNHRLEGKVMDLDKPLLLIQKQQKPKEVNDKDAVSAEQSSGKGKGKGKNTEYDMDQDDWNRRSSFSSMPPSSPPRHDDDDTMTSNIWGNDPAAVAGAREENDPMAPAGSEETIQYNTIAIIRQKILFNVMPVPIIHVERRGLTSIKRGV